MKRQTSLIVAGLAFYLATATFGEGLFEDRLAVEVERGLRGPRGMPGDIVQLKDGSLLMSYTRDASIMAVKSADQGRTWGEPFTLIPKPRPPAKGWYARPARGPNRDRLVL